MHTIDQHLNAFFAKYPARPYSAGTAIIDANEDPRGAYFLVSGQVRQFIISEEGEELTLHVFEPGSFFPMMWVMNNLPNRHTYEASRDAEIRIAPAADFTEFLRQEPELLYQFSQRLLFGLNGMLMRVESLSLQSARKRVIESLLYIARHFGDAQGNEVTIRPHFTHREIATFTGLVRETTSIEISKLEKQGYLAYRGPSLVILNTDRLASLL
jgi:CRP-like cAMP-binding protein